VTLTWKTASGQPLLPPIPMRTFVRAPRAATGAWLPQPSSVRYQPHKTALYWFTGYVWSIPAWESI